MKKYLLSLLALFSLQAMAMVEETVTFNFKQPLDLNLNPPFTQVDLNQLSDPEASGVLVNISNKTVTSGPIVLSFTRPTNTPGAGISHYGVGAPFCLEMGRLLELNFNANSGCVLKSITFDQDTELILPSGQPGSWNYVTNTWSVNDNSTSSVTLKNGDQSSKVYIITVKYLRPSTPMNFVSSSPAQGATVNGSFKTMTMSFSSAVAKVNNASNIKLTGTDIDNTPINQSMTPSISGSTVSLSIPTAITKDASLKVTAPAGTFENSEGATNQEAIVISFTLLSQRDIFNPITIEPAAGTYNELPQQIRLTFDNFVKIGEGTVKFKQQDGSGNFPANLSIDPENAKVAIISHTNGKVVDASSWIVEIPAGVFHNQYYQVDNVEDRWNAALNIGYTVDGSGAGPQDTQTMKDAKALLKLTGVGYPKTTDPAWDALNALVTAAETPTDEALLAAMTNLYNATDVQMPEVGKWYNITGFNSAGKKIYLTFNQDKTKVILGTVAGSAAAFKVKSVAADKVVFETKEGLFLHIPTILPQHEGTSDANLTDVESDINKLTFAKFLASSVAGADPAALYGAFTIYGSLGKLTVTDTEEFAYAMLDFDNTTISTYPGMPVAFASKMSSAFTLTETTEPSEEVDLIYPTVGFVPDVIDNPGDDMVMKVNGPTTTTIVDNSLIYYDQYTEEGVGPKVTYNETILTSYPTTPNMFMVNTHGLTPGVYYLIMENGAFAYTAPAGKGIRPVNIVGGPITIKSSSGEITPTASLSKTQLKAGDVLVLTIGNVGKATLKTPTAPYYEYADGENAGTKVTFSGTILTSKPNTTAEFNVNTTGLTPGKYKLVMPSETFLFEAPQAGQTVKDNVQLVVAFEILNNGGGSGDEGFVYNFNAYITYFPASRYRTNGYFKDVDLNEMYLYVFSSMASGLVANPEKEVKVVTNHGGVATTGHFENYPNFVQEFKEFIPELTTEPSYAIKFVPDVLIKEGDLDNWSGYYTYRCEPGAFGDANYGRWLNNHSSVNPADCRVSPALDIANVLVYNSRATAITNVTTETGSNEIFDLQGRRVQNMDKKGVYIVNGRKVVKK